MAKSLQEFLREQRAQTLHTLMPGGRPLEDHNVITHLGPRITRPFAQPVTGGTFSPWATGNAAGGVSGFSGRGR